MRATTSVFGDESTFHLRYDENYDDGTTTSDIFLYKGEMLTEIARGSGPYFRCVPVMDREAKVGLFFDDSTLYGWDLRQMKQLWSEYIEPVAVAIYRLGRRRPARHRRRRRCRRTPRAGSGGL